MTSPIGWVEIAEGRWARADQIVSVEWKNATVYVGTAQRGASGDISHVLTFDTPGDAEKHARSLLETIQRLLDEAIL